MGVQTMSSLGGGGGGGGGGPLSRQAAVYGLTLNEVESNLGEPLRSMNLDDLLRTVLPAAAADAEPHGSGTGRKTVDEVWRDIESAGRGRQPTVGEMTLEDFLSRAGVPVGGGGGGGCAAGAHWLHQYHPPQQYVTRPLPRPLGVGAGPVLDAVYHGGGGFLSQVGGRKRGAAVVGGDGVVEKTVERRQKRMIKNRESAARSRARKQAYTNELENKILRLEEEIEHLKELRVKKSIKLFTEAGAGDAVPAAAGGGGEAAASPATCGALHAPAGGGAEAAPAPAPADQLGLLLIDHRSTATERERHTRTTALFIVRA